MVEIFKNLLVISCLLLLGWGVIRTDRVYQYPFVIGSMFTSFLLPQAFALVNNPGVVDQEALIRILIYSSLCAAACFIGYELKPNIRWLSKLNIPINEGKLSIAALFLTAIGYLFYFLLSQTTIQTAANGNWTGPATIFVFFAQVANIGFAILILQCIKRPNLVTISFTLISGWPLLQQVIIGRRQPTMTLAIIIGLSFWLVRRYKPPRWFIIVLICSLTFLIPVFGALRADFWDFVISGNWQAVVLYSQNAFNFVLKGDLLELRNAALLMDIAEKKSLYGFGTQFWDGIIFQYVPGQIIGFDLKKSFQFNLFDEYRGLLKSLYGYKIPNGYTVTGIGDSFMEFGYFGCFLFALIAYFFKHLWVSAVYYKSTFTSIIYMGLVSPAMVGLTHGISRFIQEAIFQLFFVSLAVYYSRAKSNFRTKQKSY